MSGRVDVAAYMRLPTRSCSGLSNSGYNPAGMDSASATDTKNVGEYGSLVLASVLWPSGQKRSTSLRMYVV